MSIHYTKDMRCPVLWDELSIPPRDRIVIMSKQEFEQIGDYSRSCPTGPSPGRVYRKALNWPALICNDEDEDPNWWVYRCERAEDDPHAVDHHPFKPVFL